ncbi:MAG: hypothetical protein K6F00_08465, partial [Lachnospiraceae bacterium]|nr:hypothetical protein [Lachnospiraceae bacterium]
MDQSIEDKPVLDNTISEQKCSSSDGDIAGTLDASYYKGCGERQGIERTVVYGLCSDNSNSMMSPNPNSGIYEADTTRTLDNNGGNPACNQGGMMVVQGADMYNQSLTDDKTMSITGAATDPHHIPCVVLEGNGQRPSHKGDGYKESDIQYTLNSTEIHGVCTYQDKTIKACAWDGSQVSSTLTANNANGAQRMPDKENFNAVITPTTYVTSGVQFDEKGLEDKANTLRARDYKEPQAVCYGLDRASFNQGQNAKYDFSVEDDLAQTLVSRGPGGVLTQSEP